MSISGHKAQPALLERPAIGEMLSKHAELRPLNPSRKGLKPKFQQKLPSSAVIDTMKILSQYKREERKKKKTGEREKGVSRQKKVLEEKLLLSSPRSKM